MVADTTQEPKPVSVHVTSIAAGVQLGNVAPHDKIRTEFKTETVDDANTVRPLLPDSPDRVCAYVQVTGGDVYLCDSESKAKQAVNQSNSEVGSILPSANTAPWPVRGQGAIWIAQVTSSKTCVVSVTADYAVSS